MTERTREITIRLAAWEQDMLEALAAAEGQALEDYLSEIIADGAARLRAELAAAAPRRLH